MLAGRSALGRGPLDLDLLAMVTMRRRLAVENAESSSHCEVDEEGGEGPSSRGPLVGPPVLMSRWRSRWEFEVFVVVVGVKVGEGSLGRGAASSTLTRRFRLPAGT